MSGRLHPNPRRAASREAVEEMRERNEKIIELMKTACEKQGGMSELGEGYWVVDSKKYKVLARD